MIRKFLLAGIFVLSSISMNAQEIIVPQTQRPLLVKRTASWCSLCGGWGWNFFRSLIEETQSKAVLWANHYDGIYTNSTTTAIASNLGGVSQPVFFLNNTNQGVSSGSTASALSNIRNQVNSIFASTPLAQSGIRMSIQGGQNLTVQAKARFFQAASGEYYLGIYLVRRSFIGFQAGQGNSAEHKEVLWGHLTENVFGDLIGNGNIAAGTEVTVNGQIPLNGLDPLTLRVVTVIWKKEGNSFKVINANETTTYSQPTATQDDQPTGLTGFKVFPNISSGQATVELDLVQASELELALFSAEGMQVESIFKGRMEAGMHNFSVVKASKPTGVYFLRAATEVGNSKTIKLIFY